MATGYGGSVLFRSARDSVVSSGSGRSRDNVVHHVVVEQVYVVEENSGRKEARDNHNSTSGCSHTDKNVGYA
ncbi:hypothetical protein L596_026721 [Steinernema carpocapsae]|uniref:Uncharacterized protein n=1 Tax=Steinernema carpocapsae TaxID=34508 RepID=A0A4U5M274_STECR|nr:hypothetical protein L596_026721 [Steinernema carpocapsae]